MDRRERLRAAVGAFLGILLTALLCHATAPPGTALWLAAPMGAAAVLVFAVPSSPMAQPWPVVVGNTVSALVGVVCVALISAPEWRAAAAVGAAVAVMFALRCLHPPGGAAALLVAINGVQDWRFALFPVLANAAVLTLVGVGYNRLTRRPPAAGLPEPVQSPGPQATSEDDDLDAVLTRFNQVLDIGRDDLKALLGDLQMQAYQRKLAQVRCRDVMSAPVITVAVDTPLSQAWLRFDAHGIKALPVVDRNGGLVGIVTPADFMRGIDAATDRQAQRRAWSEGRPKTTADGVEHAVASVMTRQVRVASQDRLLVDLLPLFAGSGHHHLPIVGEQGALVGIVTQSDVVSALCQPAPRVG